MTELRLKDLPHPPFFKLVDGDGADVFEEISVGGERSIVGVLFESPERAGEFSAAAEELGMPALAGSNPRELGDWGTVEVYAASGQEYVLVVSEGNAGLFYADDVAHYAAEKSGELPYPMYIFVDEQGESPLISVEDDGSEVLVAALFSSPEKAGAFRETAEHLDVPGQLGTIADAEGLRRHALVAKRSGAHYAVIDPESGLSEAIPVEELIR